MATSNWALGDDVTSLEKEMIRCAATGELLTLGQEPSERKIRAAVLRHLLVDQTWPVQTVRMRDVQITGHLNLASEVLRCPLQLEGCTFSDTEPVFLDYATVSLLSLTRCRLAGFTGEMLTVTRDLNLSGSTFTKPLVLRRAKIDGHLDCSSAHLSASSSAPFALNAERMSIGDDVYFDQEFTASGSILLDDSRIDGQLVCSSAQLKQAERAFDDRYSLSAKRIAVGGSVYLDQKFTASGSILLDDSLIGDQLVCSGARLERAFGDDYSLSAERIAVGGSVYLGDGFSAAGPVSLSSGRVGGSLWLMPRRLTERDDSIAFDGSGMNVASTLLWRPEEQVAGLVNLQAAVAQELEDYWTARHNGYWPVGGRLRLNGFTYARIGGDNQATVGQRVAWIRSQYGQPAVNGLASNAGFMPVAYAAQPYSQLEKAYRAAGQYSQANITAIAMRRDLRQLGDLSWVAKFGNWLMDTTVRYGYQPWRALTALAMVYIVVLVVAFFAQHQKGSIVPVPQNAAGIQAKLSPQQCTSVYPCFSAAGYAFDTVVPIINLHQADYWRPNPSTPWGSVLLIISTLGAIEGWALALLAGGGSARVLAALGSPAPPTQDNSPS